MNQSDDLYKFLADPKCLHLQGDALSGTTNILTESGLNKMTDFVNYWNLDDYFTLMLHEYDRQTPPDPEQLRTQFDHFINLAHLHAYFTAAATSGTSTRSGVKLTTCTTYVDVESIEAAFQDTSNTTITQTWRQFFTDFQKHPPQRRQAATLRTKLEDHLQSKSSTRPTGPASTTHATTSTSLLTLAPKPLSEIANTNGFSEEPGDNAVLKAIVDNFDCEAYASQKTDLDRRQFIYNFLIEHKMVSTEETTRFRLLFQLSYPSIYGKFWKRTNKSTIEKTITWNGSQDTFKNWYDLFLANIGQQGMAYVGDKQFKKMYLMHPEQTAYAIATDAGFQANLTREALEDDNGFILSALLQSV